MLSRKKTTFLILTLFILIGLSNPIQSGSTKLYLDSVEYDFYYPAPPGEMWVSGNIIHIHDYQTGHSLKGTLKGIEITGSTRGYFDITIDQNGYIHGHGTSYIEFTWNGMWGYFEGIANFKIDADGISGMFTVHGYADYSGWKAFGSLSPAGPDNAICGTILIPN